MNTDHAEDREVLNTLSMIEEGFFSRLKNKNLKAIPKETVEKVAIDSSSITNTESLLLDLFEVRDGLIDMFKKADNIGENELTSQIDKLGSCIKKLGGAVDKFDPFSAKCGLKDPDLKLNAHRVIENTKRSYSLGNVGDDKVSVDGKTINISFSGVKGNTQYKAVGTLVAHKSWTGNEGIDYIYSPTSGKISVRAISDDGKWIDKSSEYNISWELYEQESDDEPVEKTVEKTAEVKKEIEKPVVNNIDSSNNEEIGDFPIIEDMTK